ncbi:MAG TPA: preprotein translocase subunit SecY [Hyphomicrobiales bacterium]|nr:preprotein translocase subunit SecY [Hyphomicrobiales bacterium]
MAKMMNPGKADGLAELKQRLLYVVYALAVYRIGTHIPVPGINPDQLQALFNQNQGTFLGLFNMFSGGAIERMSIFALGIMPYITASIIMQMLAATTPSLEQLKKEGEAGRRKISQYTRYGTLAFSLVQAIAISTGLLAQLAFTPNFSFYFTAIVSLVTGAMFLMWLGEQITERGVGNGISILITAGIVAALPSAIGQSLEQVAEGQIQPLALFVVVLLAGVVIAAVVYVERAQRRITVNYAPRQQGRKMYQGQSSHLPLKVNMAGVIPPIFASSFLLFPASLGQWFGQREGYEFLADLALVLGPGQPLNVLLFSVLVIAFCFFYTSLVFNPKEIAENLKRSGAFIPGIRPGEQTAAYVDGVMTRLTAFGSLYITLVCLLPQFLQTSANVPFQLGGTSLLIVVVVCMDFMAQVQSHLMSHQYESLMKKSNIGSFRR